MITGEQLQTITRFLEDNGVSEVAVSELRAQHKGCHFTYCMDDDIAAAKPVVERTGFNLYLVDSRDHCSGLTRDAEVASGIVVAEVVAD